MRFGKTIVLLLVALGLGLGYFFYLKPAYEEKKLIEELKRRFFRSDTSQIDYIRIQAGSEPPYELKRINGKWMIVRPAKLQVDRGALEMFMNTLREGKVLKVVDRADNLRSFGVEKVYSVIAIGYGGSIEVLYIGEENPAKTGNYAFSERLKTVFLIGKETARHLYLRLFDMREKRLFPFDKEEIGEVVLKREDDRIILKRNKGGWRMYSPVLYPVDELEMDSLLEIITTQKAEAFIPWDDRFELLKKKIEIALYDNAGRLLSSGILRYWGKAADEQCVFSLNNRNGDAMRVSRAFWILLSSHPSRFSEKRVFRIRSVDDIESITLNYEDTRYDIRKTGSTWVMKEKQYRQVDVYPLLEYVMKLSYEKIFFQKEYQFDKPFFDLSVKVNGEEQRLRVGRVDVEKEVTTTFMFVPVRPGSPEKRRVRYWLSESSATPYKGVINSEQIRAIVEGVRRYE